MKTLIIWLVLISTAVSAQASRIITDASGKGTAPAYTPCVFPFTYKGKTFTECTNSDSGYSWCSTTSTYNDQWGVCLTDGFCEMPDGYGRLEKEAKESITAASLENCETSARNRKSDWISYDRTSQTCRLYGKVDITSGVVKGSYGNVKHYSVSACQLKGHKVTAEYQQCLVFFDGTSMKKNTDSSDPYPGHKLNPYSGFTCRKGDWGSTVRGTLDRTFVSDSGVYLRRAGGPITKITLYYHSKYGLSMTVHYGTKSADYGSVEGGARYSTWHVELAKDDCINRIEVMVGPNRKEDSEDDIHSLTFHTIKGKIFGPYGNTAGTYNYAGEQKKKHRYEAKAPKGACLSFVDPYHIDNIYGIAFTFEPISQLLKP